MSRKKKRLPWQNGVWVTERSGNPQGAWLMLAFIGLMVAAVCSVPLIGRLVLIVHADGYVRTTLTVQSISDSGRRGADRYEAEGQLGSGGHGRVRLTQFTPQALPTLAALEAHGGRSPAVLDVMVNESLDDSWIGAFHVRRFDPDLRATEIGRMFALLGFIVSGMALACYGFVRSRRGRRR